MLDINFKKIYLILVFLLVFNFVSAEESYIYLEETDYVSLDAAYTNPYCYINPPDYSGTDCLVPSIQCNDPDPYHSPDFCSDPFSSYLGRGGANFYFDTSYVVTDDPFHPNPEFDSGFDTAYLYLPVAVDDGGNFFGNVEMLRVQGGFGQFIYWEDGWNYYFSSPLDVSRTLDYWEFGQDGSAGNSGNGQNHFQLLVWDAGNYHANRRYLARAFTSPGQEGPDTDNLDQTYLDSGAAYIKIIWDDENKPRHTECGGVDDCVTVPGAGVNQCSYDQDCSLPCDMGQADTNAEMCGICTSNTCQGGGCWLTTGQFPDGPFDPIWYNDRCCRDDGAENFAYFEVIDEDVCDGGSGCSGTSVNDRACCRGWNNQGVYGSICYDEYTLVDVDGDGIAGATPIWQGQGHSGTEDSIWFDCDYPSGTTYLCEDVCGYDYINEGEDHSFGEFGNGFGTAANCDPSTEECYECCGDDAGEWFIEYQGRTACCDDQDDIVDEDGLCQENLAPVCSETPTSCGESQPCTDCTSSNGCYSASGIFGTGVGYDFYRDYFCESNLLGCNYTFDDCSDCQAKCCGYGVVEICDDGKDNDCDGYTDVNDSECLPSGPVCGNGEIEDDEACDDGNTVDDCTCLADCTDPYCGDGQICGTEACDINGNVGCGAGEYCDGCNSCEVSVTPCNIIDSYWSETNGGAYSGTHVEIIEGQTVYLIIEGSSGCEGQSIQDINYLEYDLPLVSDPISDLDAESYGLPTSGISFPPGSTQISKDVTPSWFDPGEPDMIPEIIFDVVGTQNTDRSNNQLQIEQQPVVCTITDHYWTNISDGTKVPGNENIRVNHGEEVYLVVEGTNCGGKSGTLQYWEQDLVLDPITSPGDYGLPTAFSFGASDTKIIKNYSAEWYYADSGLHSGPEYVFKATIDTVQTADISNELIVDELGDCVSAGYNCCDASETCVTGHPGYYCSGGESCCEDCVVGGGPCDGDPCDPGEQCGINNLNWSDPPCEDYCYLPSNPTLQCWKNNGDGTGTRQIQTDCVEDGDQDNIGIYNVTTQTFNLTNTNQIFTETIDENLPCFLDQDIPFFDSFGIVIVLFVLVGFYFTKRKSFKKN